MESISEPLMKRVEVQFIPPLVLLTWGFVTGTVVLASILAAWPVLAAALTIAPMIISGLVLLPLGYRTFFRRDCVGMDRTIAVEWSQNEIIFRGGYFRIAIPVENVVSCETTGSGNADWTYAATIVVRKKDGSSAAMWLSKWMPGKGKFLAFLREAAVNSSVG